MSDSEPVFVTQDNKCDISPNHVCQALVIDWMNQYRKIKADQVLTATMVEMTTVARDGKSRTMSMLPIEFLSGWLFTIKKVAPEVQAKLNLYRAEGFRATYSIRIRSERLSSSMSPHLG